MIMKGYLISILICLAVCFSSGCMDQGNEDDAGPSEEPLSPLSVVITSPATGSVLSGGDRVNFNGEARGGKPPYTYQWSTPLDGIISAESSFSKSQSEMSKGRYVVVLAVADAAGASSQASITVTVL